MWVIESSCRSSSSPLTRCTGAHLRAVLRLHDGHGDHAVDVVRVATARQIVGGPSEALKDRADGPRSSKPLGDLVADIAGLEVREHEYVRSAGDLGFGHFPKSDRWNERG